MIVASPANPDVVYAGNAIIGASGSYTAFRSTDAGKTFTSLPTVGMEAMQHFITNMATHPTDANTAYILFSAAGLPKIFRTQDAGQRGPASRAPSAPPTRCRATASPT